jgi:hypothetical protein
MGDEAKKIDEMIKIPLDDVWSPSWSLDAQLAALKELSNRYPVVEFYLNAPSGEVYVVTETAIGTVEAKLTEDVKDVVQAVFDREGRG